MFKSGSTAGAVAAAIHVARRLGIGRADPVVLHASQHVSIRLLPAGPVARVVHDDTRSLDRLRRELTIARFLAARGAPIVGLATAVPPGPHFVHTFAMTFWEFVTHIPVKEDNAEHAAHAAAALRRVHQALADFPRRAPEFLGEDRSVPRLAANPIGAAGARPRR